MSGNIRNDNREQKISFEALYDTMSKEADGLYKQMITICTAFLGGSLVFFEKLFVSDAGWAIYFLFGGWAALTYPLAVLIYVRWQNVEAHRHILEYLKTESEIEYNKAVAIPKRGRKWTTSAIISMLAGLILIATFTAINIIYRQIGG